MLPILYLAIVLASTGSTDVITADKRPIKLEAQTLNDGVELIVKGNSVAFSNARFRLDVESTGNGGVTKTTQAGTNSRGGVNGILLYSKIKTKGLRFWSARLSVFVDGGEYIEALSSHD